MIIWVTTMEQKQITVLGVGNILFSDEGTGVRVLEALYEQYEFPSNVTLVDGGVLGMNLLGIISEADHLIVIDAVRNGQKPGTLYRLEGDEIPQRIPAKNSLHQVDLLEALTCCQALDKQPHPIIVGVEPQDIKTVSLELTPPVAEKTPAMIKMVLSELEQLGVTVSRRQAPLEDSDKHDGDQTADIPKI